MLIETIAITDLELILLKIDYSIFSNLILTNRDRDRFGLLNFPPLPLLSISKLDEELRATKA